MKTKMSEESINSELVKMAADISKNGQITPCVLEHDDFVILSQKCNLPTKFVSLYLKDFSFILNHIVYSKIEKYIKQFWSNLIDGKGLYISGPVGTGKTATATLILKYMYAFLKREKVYKTFLSEYLGPLNCEEPIYFWTSRSMLQEYFKRNNDFDRIITTSYLVLDDIGKVSQEFYLEVLDHILRTRDHHGLPTIITSQFPLEQVEDELGPAVFDLIKGSMKEIQLVGDSQRKLSNEREEE